MMSLVLFLKSAGHVVAVCRLLGIRKFLRGRLAYGVSILFYGRREKYWRA